MVGHSKILLISAAALFVGRGCDALSLRNSVNVFRQSQYDPDSENAAVFRAALRDEDWHTMQCGLTPSFSESDFLDSVNLESDSDSDFSDKILVFEDVNMKEEAAKVDSADSDSDSDVVIDSDSDVDEDADSEIASDEEADEENKTESNDSVVMDESDEADTSLLDSESDEPDDTNLMLENTDSDTDSDSESDFDESEAEAEESDAETELNLVHNDKLDTIETDENSGTIAMLQTAESPQMRALNDIEFDDEISQSKSQSNDETSESESTETEDLNNESYSDNMTTEPQISFTETPLIDLSNGGRLIEDIIDNPSDESTESDDAELDAWQAINLIDQTPGQADEMMEILHQHVREGMLHQLGYNVSDEGIQRVLKESSMTGDSSLSNSTTSDLSLNNAMTTHFMDTTTAKSSASASQLLSVLGKPSIKSKFKLKPKKGKFEIKLEFKYNQKLFKVKGVKMKSKIGMLFHFKANILNCQIRAEYGGGAYFNFQFKKKKKVKVCKEKKVCKKKKKKKVCKTKKVCKKKNKNVKVDKDINLLESPQFKADINRIVLDATQSKGNYDGIMKIRFQNKSKNKCDLNIWNIQIKLAVGMNLGSALSFNKGTKWKSVGKMKLPKMKIPAKLKKKASKKKKSTKKSTTAPAAAVPAAATPTAVTPTTASDTTAVSSPTATTPTAATPTATPTAAPKKRGRKARKGKKGRTGRKGKKRGKKGRKGRKNTFGARAKAAAATAPAPAVAPTAAAPTTTPTTPAAPTTTPTTPAAPATAPAATPTTAAAPASPKSSSKGFPNLSGGKKFHISGTIGIHIDADVEAVVDTTAKAKAKGLLLKGGNGSESSISSDIDDGTITDIKVSSMT